MFALERNDPNRNDPQTLNDAIDELCNILDGDREEMIHGLADIVQRQGAFELLRITTFDERYY